ncbi:MAG: NnrS family protein [Methyloversatilis sp.]|uniref:NnrS family protein n=1 Tax=Methyloversatilis sp. TaxID=2569862 RepID=UPI0027374485|nr:NnrS family protein [Methyloversatilis sp.]MDP3872068.1 NnrS family protein [Methyloversatilis sp.]
MKSIQIQAPVTAAAPGPVGEPGWHLRWLLAAPHRLGFFAGALMLGGSALWWAAVLLMRTQGLSATWAASPPAAHALLMSLGFTPLFIVGFLFTAGPRWLGQPDEAARCLLVPVLTMSGGWCITWPGLHLHAGAAGTGMLLVAAGWSVLCWRFATILRASRVPDRSHARVVALACTVGALTMWVAAAALLMGSESLLRAATQVALWGFVATVFTAVSHRMVPFFSASALPLLDAWRPMALLWLIVGALWFEVPFALAQLWWWPLPAALRWAQVVVELPAAALLLWLAVRWGLVQSLKIRMLAMLHAGFLWLGITFALSATSHALMASSGDTQSLGLAPIHALTMGYLGATLFAMATRVSSGHSGRSLAADNTAWALYWVLQSAVLLRVVAALWPALATPLTVLAVLAWATAVVGWALRYGNWFVRARVDGRPG